MNWKRAAVGACTAAALVAGAGLALAPTADAASGSAPTGGTSVLGGVAGGVSTVVGGLTGTPTPAPTSTQGTGTQGGGTQGGGTQGGGIGVGVTGGTGVVVTTGGGVGLGVVIGGGSSGSGATVTGPTGPTGPTGTGPSVPADPGGTPTSTSSPAPAAPATLSGLSVVSQYPTVYPAKDGYRDTVTFTLNGTASDGMQHMANGVATLTFGSGAVMTWPISATNQVVTWNGLLNGRIVPGRYVFTATIGDGSASVSASDAVDVSAKKLASTSSLLTSRSISGTHRMAPEPLAGLKTGKVTVRVISSVTGVTGKQYLLLKHGGKVLRIRIRNGKHTSKAVTIPRSFTTYTISHTWKKHTVRIRTLQYRYIYRTLK